VSASADRTFDAIVLGAGPAGLNAALALGGATRRVLLLDGGPPRNARAEEAHGVFTRDGIVPVQLKDIGLRDLGRYDVTVLDTPAREIRAIGDDFHVRHEHTWSVAPRLLFATGVQDILPRIPGLRERWGHTVHHCPYCDGWPNRDAPLGILGRHQEGHHLALTVRAWTDHVVLFTDGPDELSDEQREDLRRVGVPVVDTPILRVSGRDSITLHFRGGERHTLDALFLNPAQRQNSLLPELLGCEMNDKGRVVVNEHGMTSVRGVWAAGDMTGAPQYVMSAASTGLIAGISLNTTLIHAAVRNLGAAFTKSDDEAGDTQPVNVQ
jgi:thioredoxin reductase